MVEKKAAHMEELDPKMITIQANIDDMNPEIYSYLIDLLLEAGAREVYLTPIIMKKGRPGTLLSVLCGIDQLETMETLIFQETTTLGLRYHPTTCHRLERKIKMISTPWGEIPVKIGLKDGKIINLAPEYENCVFAAKQYHIPLKRVYDFIKGKLET